MIGELCILVYARTTSPDWMIYPGENGRSYFALLDEQDGFESTGINSNNDVTFHLYTR